MDSDNSAGNDRPFKRDMIQGDWQCSECGAKITELPFEPSEGRPIFCRDCYRNKRPQRNFRR
ncbi:hypothetical protein KJ763_01400 [Patescibacteria group bacterium]|nr:hypothetical protein [Patescibacteria group bacterium]